ncbi:MAG: hypothetical protein KTR16_11630 [Acidiferrobacterales bacterium]|nr:hypothetical protein [Acidiferrobacterales bacterium]
MKREDKLNQLVKYLDSWDAIQPTALCEGGWVFYEGKYSNLYGEQITVDDWSRAVQSKYETKSLEQKIDANCVAMGYTPVHNANARVLAEKVGAKHDQGKPLYNLIPVHAEAELVDVLTFGATKYTPNQWRTVDNAKERYTAAAMRHLAAYRMGEESDPESGKHHLAHAMCCLSFIIELDLEN